MLQKVSKYRYSMKGEKQKGANEFFFSWPIILLMYKLNTRRIKVRIIAYAVCF